MPCENPTLILKNVGKKRKKRKEMSSYPLNKLCMTKNSTFT